MKEQFKFLLFADGCTVCFAILQQPEKWRIGTDRCTKRVMSNGIHVMSSIGPEIRQSFGTVFLRGRDCEWDLKVHTSDYADPDTADEVVDSYLAALTEFATTGGFEPQPTSKSSGPVHTFDV